MSMQPSAFLSDIIERPDDDTPRLVFADWLDENNQPDRAEFIRLQCELAKPTTSPRRRLAIKGRAQALQQRCGKVWVEDLPDWAREYAVFDRGFVHRVMGRASEILRDGPRVWQQAPITEIGVTDLEDQRDALFASPLLGRLRRLELAFVLDGPDDVRALQASPHLENLSTLDLIYNETLGDEGAIALSGLPPFPALESLILWECGLSDTGATALAASPFVRNLTSLDLGKNNLTSAGARALASSPHLDRLTALGLGYNEDLGDAGVRALARGKGFSHLHNLRLSRVGLGAAGLSALVGSPLRGRLESLGLDRNSLGDKGVAALASSSTCSRLTLLDLKHNAIGPAGAGPWLPLLFSARSKGSISTATAWETTAPRPWPTPPGWAD
jgi:uncharacterized protein (TIGR02996 family)